MIRIVSNYFLQKINLNNNDLKPNKKNYKLNNKSDDLSNIARHYNSLIGLRLATFSLLVYNYARNSRS